MRVEIIVKHKTVFINYMDLKNTLKQTENKLFKRNKSNKFFNTHLALKPDPNTHRSHPRPTLGM